MQRTTTKRSSKTNMSCTTNEDTSNEHQRSSSTDLAHEDTAPSSQNPPSPLPSPKRSAMPDRQHKMSRVYGQFQREQYTVIKGYIPTKGTQIRLFYTKYEPKKKVASICIVHGYGESTQNYLDMAEYFAKNRIVVHIVDLRGFGYSGGYRVQADVTSLLEDIQVLLRCAESSLPLFLLSHGFGSLLSLSLLCQNPRLPINGFIAISPTFKFSENQNTGLVSSLIRQCSLYIFRDTLVNNHLNPSSLTKNPRQLKRRLEEGLAYQYITLNMLNELEKISCYVNSNSDRILFPTAIYAGAKNSFQNIEQVQQLFQKISSKDKTFRSFSEGYHNMHLDDESTEVQSEILKWVFERLEGSRKQRHIPPLVKHSFKGRRNTWIFKKVLFLVTVLVLALKVIRKLKWRFF